jgi:protein ImuB
VLRDRDASAEAAALAEVATLLLAFTPQVSIALPDAVLAEIEGSVRLFGGLSRCSKARAVVQRRGYGTRMALAPTPIAALLLARAGLAEPCSTVTGWQRCSRRCRSRCSTSKPGRSRR